jgi:BlaI family transcriptional regulator, penicillinase repressor
MPRPPSSHPTESELAILKVLWKSGPATVRSVQEDLAAQEPGPSTGRDWALTTVTTMLNIMVEKGDLAREKQGARFEYRPLVSAEANSARMVSDLVERVFDGSASALVLNLLQQSQLDPEELKALRRLIDKQVRQGSKPQ